MKARFVLLFLGLTAFCAYAEIYKHVDADGRVTYSNVPIKGAKKLDLDPLTSVPATKAKSPSNFPRVDGATQKSRDEGRRKILEEELANEEKLLAEARKTYNNGEPERLGDERNYQKYLDRAQKLKESVALHEKNVAALKQELSGLH